MHQPFRRVLLMEFEKMPDVMGQQHALLAGRIFQDGDIGPALLLKIVDVECVHALAPQLRRQIGIHIFINEER